jgi:RNA polymerase sigma factor (TIGR02999 family)
MLADMPDVTRILSAIEAGDPKAAGELLPLVYDELRKLAAARLAGEKPGQTLQATALVHEAYLRLVGDTRPQGWDGRGHFFAAAAEAMRRILVEAARRKGRVRHGGGQRRIDLDEHNLAAESPGDDLLAMDEALTRLAQLDPRRAELVKLRFFAGLTMPEAAVALGISLATAERQWAFARTWLYAELSDANPTDSSG